MKKKPEASAELKTKEITFDRVLDGGVVLVGGHPMVSEKVRSQVVARVGRITLKETTYHLRELTAEELAEMPEPRA